MAEPTIEDYYLEDRTFPPPEDFKKPTRSCRRPSLYEEAERRLRGLLGPAGGASCSTGSSEWRHDPRVGPAVRQVVRRRQAQRLLQLPRPPRRGRAAATRSPTTGRASPATPARSPTPSCYAEVQRFANVLKGLGVEQGRPGRHLHADDPRAAGRDAGLRPDRRRPLGRVRRLLVRRAARPDQRRRGQGPRHRRRGLAPGRAVPLKANADEALAATPVDRARGRRAAHRDRRRRWSTGRDHWYARPHGRRGGRLPGRADGRRGPPLPALHLGHDGQAQGHHAHHRRLPDPGRLHPQVRLRPAPRHRRLLVRGRHRLGHRPQLHRLRAAGQRRHVGDVRGHARHPEQGPVVGHRRALRRDASSTPRPPPSGRS